MSSSSSMPFSRVMAEFAYNLGDVAHTPDAQRTATTRIVDTLGCLVGARASEAVATARRTALIYTGSGSDARCASMIGTVARLPVETAAFVNGIAARYLDYNDIYISKEAVHPSDNIPVGLALAEALGRSGAALLEAVIKGYEVHCRLADTLTTRKGGWDNVVLGAIASSVMAGSLLELDPTRQAEAINIAAAGHVALMQTRVGELSMWKAAAAANAARAGLFAALLASEGFTGPTNALDGSHGLFARVTGPGDPSVFAPRPASLRLSDTHLKAFPSQYFTQTAIEAALHLRGAARPEEIRRIVVSTFEFGRVAAADTPEKWCPVSRETADHSLPYCVAVALIDGAVGETQFTEDRIRRSDVQSLMQRIEVVEDQAFTQAYPAKVPTSIAIDLAEGRTLSSLVEYPLGHSSNPMSREQVNQKFLDLVGQTPQSEALLHELWRLPGLDGHELAALLSRLLARTETPG